MSALTEYGVTVKKRLIDLGMSQKDLAEAVSKRTGLFIDNGYLYKILTGSRTAPKIIGAINEVLDLTCN